MPKNLRKILLFALLICSIVLHAQNINLVRFNNSLQYAIGSGVSVLINPIDTFKLDNKFILELSDLGGGWTNPKTLTTINEFYVPVINGTLPSGLSAGTYKLRVRSTNPTANVVTESFNVVSGTGIGLPNFKSKLFNPSNAQFTCLGECSPQNNLFGQLNVAVGEQTAIINEDDRVNEICGFSSLNNYKVFLIDILNNQVKDIIVKPNGQFIIPNNLSIGTYVFEIEVTKSEISSTYSNIFLFHGNSTGLNNLSAETVCIGSDVLWSVDNTSATGIGRNYYGSKYEINFGDGSSKMNYTHAQLLQKGQINHTFNSVSCKSGTLGSPNQGYYIIQLKLFNKGIFNSGNNSDYCKSYYENGNGADKRVNTSKAPIADFEVNIKQCISLAITATNKTILGQYGTTECLNIPKYTWAYKKPSSLDFITVTTNDNLTIPVSELDSGCWEIRLRAQNAGAGCVTTTEKIKSISIEAIPIALFTSSPQSPICAGGTISFTHTSNVTTLACQHPTYTWSILPNSGFVYQNSTNSTSKDIAVKFTEANTYTVSLSVTNSCGTIKTSQTIIVNGDPTVTFNPSTNTICKELPAVYTIDFSLAGFKPVYGTGVYSPSSYEWTVTGTGVISSDYSFTGGTTASSQYPKIMFTAFKTYTIRLKVNGNCSGSNQADFTFTLKRAPILNTIQNQTICSGTSFTDITLTSDIAETTYKWIATGTSGVTGFTNSGTGNIIPGKVLTNTTNTVQTVTFSVTPTFEGCDGTVRTFTVTVNPLPTISGTLSACVGSNSQLTGSGTAAATSPWTSSNTTVASVDNTGLVAALISGTSTI
ncbi:MAG: PKD-like domain-containing protein, partial [Paludibacter sp.]|nr:PKD-like domain-containing protein [Paludibacter sp.]